MLRNVTASLPPHIGDIQYVARSSKELDRALREVALLEEIAADLIAPLGRFLIRIESVASSKIESQHRKHQSGPGP